MSSKERREGWLLDMIARGASAAEINHAQEERAARRAADKAEGDESERVAAEAISSLPYMARVVIVSGEAEHDLAGHDLKAVVDRGLFERTFGQRLVLKHDSLYVQVKSSVVGAEAFRERTRGKHKNEPHSIEEILFKARIAVVHTGSGPEQLLASFQEQLVAMNSFWAGQ